MVQHHAAFGEAPLERPNWYEGRPVTAAGLDEQQALFRERMRRRNRLLHGWGIVRGLEVTTRSPGTLVVAAGFALDAAGNEILIPSETTVDAGRAGLEPDGATHWLAVRWDESPTGEHPPEAPDVSAMAAAFVEDFELALLAEDPGEQANGRVDVHAAPWLVLATVVRDADTLRVDPAPRTELRTKVVR